MNRKTLALQFARIGASDKARILSRVAFDLTIDARDTYIPGTEGIADPVRLRAINELQHRICGRVHDLLENQSDQQDDSAFANMIVATLEDLRCPLALATLKQAAANTATGPAIRRTRAAS